MDALTRLREAIEETHDGSRPLNDETYRTMMEDLRNVYQAIPQRAEHPVVVAGQPPAGAETEAVVNWNSDGMSDNNNIRMLRSDYNQLKQSIRYEIGAYEFGWNMVPVVSLILVKLNANALGKSDIDTLTQYQKVLFDKVAEHIYDCRGGTYVPLFYEKIAKTWWWRTHIVRRVFGDSKMLIARWVAFHHKFTTTNPEELMNPKHLPMLCYFAMGRNANLVGSMLKFEETMEAGRKGGDFTTNLQKNNVEKLHKLSITLRHPDKSRTFEAYTSHIKMGSIAGMTDLLHQLIFFMDFLEGKVNTKVLKTAMLWNERTYPPTLDVSGITARTKDKRRHYVDRHEQYTITYVTKLNNGD